MRTRPRPTPIATTLATKVIGVATATKSRARERLIEFGAHPARPVALRETQQLLKKESEADRSDQRLLALGATQRNEDRKGRGEPPARRDGRREREGGCEKRGGRGAGERKRRHRSRV